MVVNFSDYVNKRNSIESKKNLETLLAKNFLENQLKRGLQISISVPEMTNELYALISKQSDNLTYDDLEYYDINPLMKDDSYLRYLKDGYKKVACIYYDKESKKFIGIVAEGIPSAPNFSIKYREVNDLKSESEDFLECINELGEKMSKTFNKKTI